MTEALPADLLAQFEQLVGADNLLTSAADCIAYSYDNSRLQAMPQAVLLPDSGDCLPDIIHCCYQRHLPVVVRGRGTGTTGATVPDRGGVVLSLERLDRILEIDAANRLARVEPGVLNQTLQDALAQQGFFWPPDPTSAANCTVGGNLAYNSAGPRAIKYGTPRENTLGLTAIDGTGKLFHTGVKTTKGVVGYDLTRLLIGSEGTLAVISEATLKLTPLPAEKKTLQACFTSVQAAAEAISAIMAQPESPCALEFMDEAAINMVRSYSDLGLDDAVRALLMIEADGHADSLAQTVAAISRACQVDGLYSLDLAEDASSVERLWKTRKALSPALRNVAPKKINEDVVVPVSKIPALIDGLQAIASRHGIQIVNFGHAGNGNLHVNLLYDPQNLQHAGQIDACLQAVFELVLALEGTLSGEHGIGLVKRDYVGLELDGHAINLMHRIKQQFDPHNILNPGKMLPADLQHG